MKFTSPLIALAATLLPFSAALPTLANALASGHVPGKYIVTLKEGTNVKTAVARARVIHAQALNRREAGATTPSGIEKTYEGNFLGYSGGFDEATIEELKNSDEVG
jgi:oryzin